MSVLILCYHSISDNHDARIDPSIVVHPRRFEEQLRYFAAHWRVISLADFVESLRHQRKLSSNSLVLTFDDGYRDNLTIAAPLLQKYNLPATFFLTTGCLDTGQAKWEDRLSFILHNTQCTDLTLDLPDGASTFRLRAPQDRTRAFYRAARILERIPHPQRESLITHIQARAQIVDAALPSDTMLTWADARDLAVMPRFTIGSHTVTHERLSTLTDTQIRREFTDSRQTIRANLGIDVRFLSYPYGTWLDIDPRTLQIAQESGFDCGLTTQYQSNELNSEPFSLGRVFGANTSGPRFQLGTLIRASWLGQPLRQMASLLQK